METTHISTEQPHGSVESTHVPPESLHVPPVSRNGPPGVSRLVPASMVPPESMHVPTQVPSHPMYVPAHVPPGTTPGPTYVPPGNIHLPPGTTHVPPGSAYTPTGKIHDPNLHQPSSSMEPHILSGISSVKIIHEQIRNDFDRLLQVYDLKHKARLWKDTVKLISQHDVAEEVILFPAIKNLGMGHLLDTARVNCVEMERVLYDMNKRYKHGINDNATFNSELQGLKNMFNNHLGYLEQMNIIPLLEKCLSYEDIESLNSWFDKVRMLAPTRPHPDGPHSVAGKLAVGPIVSFIDHFRDLSKKFTH
jgi:hypothetical protein